MKLYLVLLQELASFFILVTLNVCAVPVPVAVPVLDDPAESPPEAGLEPVVPLTSTWLFTCELSFEVSP